MRAMRSMLNRRPEIPGNLGTLRTPIRLVEPHKYTNFLTILKSGLTI